MLGEAIRNSVNVLLSIGGFITLFSVIINILIEIGFISAGVFYFAVSVTFGISREIVLAVLVVFWNDNRNKHGKQSGKRNLQGQLAAVSLLLGWAGLSVHFQVYSIISHTDISIKPYLFGKMLQGVFAAIYISIAMKLPFTASLTAKSVLSVITPFSDLHGTMPSYIRLRMCLFHFDPFDFDGNITYISFIKHVCKTLLKRSVF